MAKQVAVGQLIKTIEQSLDDVRTEFLKNMAEDLVARSPVDTGAYVTSHSITTTSGAGRSRTSDNKPKGQNKEAKQAEALDQLYGDIAAIPAGQELVYIANRSPHANQVETGWATKDGYFVYQAVRSRAGAHLTNAIGKVRNRT